MALLDIHLTAKEGNWRLFMIRKADPAFLAYQEKVFKRDEYTCQYCGFRSNLFQDVLNQDGNYLNNRIQNLVTACVFCSQCFFLEAVGQGDFGGGSLIYLPEMSQGELNALCHLLFASLVSGNSYSSQAKSLYRSLRLRAQPVEQKLGEGMSNPALYGRMLIDTHHDQKEAMNAELSKKIRVLPQLPRFFAQVYQWQLNAMNTLTELVIE